MASITAPSPIFIGSADIADVERPSIYNTSSEATRGYFIQNPKNLFQFLRYSSEWAGIFRSSLKEIPMYTKWIAALKPAVSIFYWPESLKSLDSLIKDWYQNASISKYLEDGCDLISKVSEVFRWAKEARIIAISEVASYWMMGANGIAMMYSLSQKVKVTLEKLEKAPENEKSFYRWKIAKYISLFAIGVLLTFFAYCSTFHYTPILVCATISLVASYAEWMIAKFSYKVYEDPAKDTSQQHHISLIFRKHHAADPYCTLTLPKVRA